MTINYPTQHRLSVLHEITLHPTQSCNLMRNGRTQHGQCAVSAPSQRPSMKRIHSGSTILVLILSLPIWRHRRDPRSWRSSPQIGYTLSHTAYFAPCNLMHFARCDYIRPLHDTTNLYCYNSLAQPRLCLLPLYPRTGLSLRKKNSPRFDPNNIFKYQILRTIA